MQRTLILLKPDCLEKQIAGQVISRFENQGYSIMASKMIQLDDELLQEHYAHVAHLPFFPDIAAFMSSRPVMALILEGENVIQGVRDLLGPTDSTVAPSGTIRSAKASAENPPNTTECTAPIRAQASIATAASGTMGM